MDDVFSHNVANADTGHWQVIQMDSPGGASSKAAIVNCLVFWCVFWVGQSWQWDWHTDGIRMISGQSESGQCNSPTISGQWKSGMGSDILTYFERVHRAKRLGTTHVNIADKNGVAAFCEVLSGTTTTLHSFNGLFSTTTWISRYQKGKPFWILLEQEVMGVAVTSAGPYANHLHLAPDR